MKDFLKHNGVLILVIAVLLAGVTLVVSLFLGGTAEPTANLFYLITTPVRNGVAAAGDWVEGLYSDAFEAEKKNAELDRLRKELSDMAQKARDGEAASRENENLRALLGLQEKRRDFVFESAMITAQGTSNWSSSFTISKGSGDGVAVDHCVVDPYGNLCGIVTEVGYNWATVSTIIDTGTQLGGLIGRSDSAAILEGDFALMGKNRLKLSYLPEHTELIAGDVVLTSGKGGVYPSGLVVGSVEAVRTDENGMSRYAVIAPETDLPALKQVFVIKEFDIVE